MAIYRIEAPDGKTYRLEGPAGASHDELIQALKAKFPYADLTTQELENMPRAPMSLGDTARSGIAGLLGAVGSIASAAGAETETARGIRKYGDEFIEGMTPARKEEMQREAELSRRAEGKGTLEEIKADVRSVTDAPVQAVAQGLGSSVPAIAAGLGVMVAGAPALYAAGVALFAKLAIGALQGAGETKASIFDTVTQQLMEQKGLSRAEAEAEATKAQEYIGKNSLSILGGAGAGMLDSVLGVESVFGKTAKATKTPLTQPSKLATTGKVAIEEAIPEGIQGGVGKLAENIALQNAGIDTSTFQGVAGASVRDALMGALTGAAVSPLQYFNLRREYAQEKERKVEEEKAKIDEAVKKEEEEIAAKTREADAELLAEPPREVKTPQNIHPIRNPLGNFSKEELQQGVPEAIDEYRKRLGLPALETYSIEDIVDAMPGIEPELEKKHIDNILTMRTGYEGDPLTAEDVVNQAKAKGISQDQAFQDFLLRTTGESDLKSMSQPQLYSAFKSINELPENAELEEGTNAARFTDEQYKSAIDSLDKLIGEDTVLVSDALADIKISTGLNADRFAKSILDAAVRRRDFDRKGQSITPPTTAEALPKGYEIQEGVFEKGEKPEGFQVKFGESLTDTVYATREEAEGRVEELTAAKGKVINQINNEIKQLENAIERDQAQLDQVAAMPNINGIEYKKYEAITKSKIKDSQKRIADLQGQIAKLDPEVLEISVVPAPVRKVKAKGFTLFKDKSAIEMFKSREEAERAIVSKMSDKELTSIVKAKGRRTLKKKAQEELDNRYLPKEEAPEVAPKEKPKAEFEPTLRALLDKFGLQNVALNIKKDMDAGGEYSKSVIKIALDNTNPVRTLRHESVHALKELGFFAPQQWKTLENEAKSKWIDTYLKQRNINGDPLEEGQQSRYDAYMDVYGGDQDAIIEEAIADAFGDFDMNKAPPGLMTAILKRLKLFFEALQNALTGAGFQTYEDVFGKAERGELVSTQPVVKPSEPKYDKTDAWQATPEERQEAMEMYDKDGFLPYVSQGRLNIPIDDVKYSLQKFNPEKHLDFDSTLGVPINKDGTVTMYYHTTKAESLAINTSKVIPANGRSRIYLTNESSGAKVIPNKGNMEQEIDGSTVLVYVTPDMLQVDDTKYEDGRVDLYIPVAQGEYFNKKMKQHSIQKARTEAIATEFSYEDHEKRITDSIKKYQAASQKERAAMRKQARGVLKREHNIGSLLTENGKLEKTRMGDYNLSYDGMPVASQGLGLASAQKITDKVSTCPRSSICEGLCLGETSGGNFMFGGAAAEDVGDIQKSAFRAGARMIQYLKTEALIVNPEAFAVLLQAEIDSLKRWSASPTVRKKNPETGKVGMVPKDIYAPAVRLNVTSDFKPSMFRGVIEGNEDVMFYDYTKINSDTIAPNHHITYSSTGFGQNVDGKPVYFTNKAGKYDHNWSTVRDRLNNGFNVAMAFSSKSALPQFLTDEKTGQTYRILDGDLYDARYLDQYSKEKEESGNLGVIVGLRNKAGNLSEKNATEKTQGFFVKYDPKTDGDTVMVPDQDQFKQIDVRKTIPIKKLSLRDTPQFKDWFGDSKIVNADGTPKVMYHGTARDISEFQPKQANAIFVTDDPKFAEDFSKLSEDYIIREVLGKIPAAQREELFNKADAIAKRDGTYAPDEVNNLARELLRSSANIMPVYVSAQNPFDYENLSHIKKLKEVYGDADTLKAIRQGSYTAIESNDVQEAIKFAGFDGFYVEEAGRKNLAVYNPEQIKSATGNSGMYDKYNPDIRYDLRNSTDPTIRASTDRITTARDQRGFVERIVGALKDDDAWSKFRANALNRYNRLGEYDKALVKKMGGARLLADSSAEAAALMSDLGAGLTASALGVHDRAGGIPVYKNGVTTVTNLNNTVKGPVAIFAPLSKYGDPYIYQLYQFWAGSKRGRRLMADGKEHVYTQADFKNATKLEKQYPEFVQIQKEWIKYNNGLVKFLVDTGVLSQDKADEFTKYSDYVPFYRQMNGDTTIGPNLFSSISGVKGPKKLKGGEAPLADFLETIVRNTQSSIQMGIKNVAAARAADVAVKINEATRLPGCLLVRVYLPF